MQYASNDATRDRSGAVQARLGTRELVVYDPEGRGKRDRNVWRVHRRRRDGFYLVTASDEDRVRSEALGCWLRIVGRGDARRVRVATGRHGENLVPTPEELAERARAAARAAMAERDAAAAQRDAAAAERDAARRERDTATAERNAALAELERLKARLARRTTRR
jgi:hypothetical protein